MSAGQMGDMVAAMIWFAFAAFNLGGRLYKNIYVKSPDNLLITSIIFAVIGAGYIFKAVKP